MKSEESATANDYMDIQLINNNLLSVLHWKAKESERQRRNFNRRTTP